MDFRQDQFETGVTAIDGTYGRIFGGTADVHQRMVRGIRWYRINDVDVSQEEYERRLIVRLAASVWTPFNARR